MSVKIPYSLMYPLAKFIKTHTGLNFPPRQWKELEKRITAASGQFGFEDVESCINWLLSSDVTREQIDVLARSLTIGETYFFRDKKSWDFIEHHVLHEFIQSYEKRRRRLRIWVAGCSTGEESYTIAILLHRLIQDLKDWNITILATDINTQALQKAEAGVYPEWSFRETPAWIKDRYFLETGEGCYQIIPSIKEMVSFSYLNLADDDFPSLSSNTNGMDIIFCRNVLMYFHNKTAMGIIHHFTRCLAEHGILLVSGAELHLVSSSFLARMNYNGASFYRKYSSRKDRDRNESRQLTVKEPPFNEKPVIPFKKSPVHVEKHLKQPIVKKIQKGCSFEEAEKLYRSGSFSESADMLKILSDKVKAGNPSYGKSCSLLARNLANLGRLNEALQWSEKAGTEEKSNPTYHYLQALIHMELGQNGEAAAALMRTLYLNHNSALAHYTFGNLLRTEGKTLESRKQFRNAFEILSKRPSEEVLNEMEGLTAGRLVEIVSAVMSEESTL
jgi:chemotaxis protein methyltransferase CheR